MKKELQKKIELMPEILSTFSGILEEALSEEEECFDKMSERSQESERGELLQERIDSLSSALDSINDAMSYIEEIEF